MGRRGTTGTQGGGSRSRAPARAAARRKSSARLIVPFDPAPLLKPEYLCTGDRLPARSPLREPQAYWTREAAIRLDTRMRQLEADGREHRVAERALGDAPSFHAKCERFFKDAARDLDELERLRVSPNVIAASIVLYAWDWRIRERSPERTLLAQGPRAWAKRFKILYSAEGVLLQLQPVAGQVDLIEPPLRRTERDQARRKLDLDFTNVNTDGEWTHDDDDEEWRSEWWPGEGRLLARAARTARDVATVAEELKQAARQLRHEGRAPQDKLDCLVNLLAALVRARTGEERHERLARLLRW